MRGGVWEGKVGGEEWVFDDLFGSVVCEKKRIERVAVFRIPRSNIWANVYTNVHTKFDKFDTFDIAKFDRFDVGICKHSTVFCLKDHAAICHVRH